jgi:hypothetical protein
MSNTEYLDLHRRSRKYYALRIFVFYAMAAAFLLGAFGDFSGPQLIPKTVVLTAAIGLAYFRSKAVIAIVSLQLGRLSPQIIYALGLPGLVCFAAESWDLFPSALGDRAFAVLGGAFFAYLAAGALVAFKLGPLGAAIYGQLEGRHETRPSP